MIHILTHINTCKQSSIPFAVIGADTIIEVAGKRIRGRRYPWGIVDVDNPDHCDFAKLRQMLIRLLLASFPPSLYVHTRDVITVTNVSVVLIFKI